MLKALFVGGRVVTGVHHGDAFSKLSENEKNSRELLSGFWDDQTGKFVVPDSFTFFTKKIILVRHSLVQEHEESDPSLSYEGHNRCCKTARFLVDTEDLTGFVGYTSPMLRCLETAANISRLTGIKFAVDPSFVEAFPTPIEVPNRRELFPDFRWDSLDSYCLGEETPIQFARRLEQVIKTMPQKAIIISHCTFIANMAELISGNYSLQDTYPSIPAASVTLIDNYKIVYVGKQAYYEEV